ncbi:MAG: BolA/IbaG family iron-sulfur metabolism protein [Myxococcota bacterium]
MALRILSEPPPEPEALAAQIADAVRGAIPDARVEVQAGSPGHFALRVTSTAFEGLPRVRQQQKVYAAIQHLMAGDAAPVHAIDRLITQTP